ncbi:MAG TPA: MFS transporter [Ignavibacteriaceae bacterium]|nr:MFS transporter [Ignavibacteriaceae bacterium]
MEQTEVIPALEEKEKSFTEVIKNSFKELKDTTIAFVKAPQALWGINVPYVLEGLVYFGILTELGIFSSENVGLIDSQASLVYSFVTGGITFAMLLFGGYSDKIGVRKSLIISFIVFLAGRILVSLSGTLGLSNGLWSPMFFTMISGLFIMVTAYGLYQPAAYAGVKRYTTPKTAAIAYGAIYGFMNLGAFLSGFVASLTRQNFETTFPPNGLTAVFWAFALITFIALILCVGLLTKKADADAVAKANAEKKPGEEEKTEEGAPAGKKVNNIPLLIYGGIAVLFFLLSSVLINIPVNFVAGLNVLGAHIKIDLLFILSMLFLLISIYEFLKRRPHHPFRDKRFSFFVFILIPVQTLFAHNWLTIPYYTKRAFPVASVVHKYYEVFSNINPILIFILAPVIAGLTSRANVYRMMILGTIVMAIPTFLLTAGPNIYLFLLYVFISTVGEAMWQPRFLQWIAEVAPKGMTGLYMGVGQFPWFLTKVITGFYSGWFLMHYCPDGVPPSQMNTQFMWFIYGLIAIVSPIGLILAKNWMIKGFKEKSAQ